MKSNDVKNAALLLNKQNKASTTPKMDPIFDSSLFSTDSFAKIYLRMFCNHGIL